MRTTTAGETHFIHHSDYSGGVTIKRADGELKVPAADLRAFALEQLRNRLIDEIESMEPDDLVKWLMRGIDG